MINANSNNHNGDGQNVLYADGHVECRPRRTAARRGRTDAPRDNIYTAPARPRTSTKASHVGTQPTLGPWTSSTRSCCPTDDAGGD